MFDKKVKKGTVWLCDVLEWRGWLVEVLHWHPVRSQWYKLDKYKFSSGKMIDCLMVADNKIISIRFHFVSCNPSKMCANKCSLGVERPTVSRIYAVVLVCCLVQSWFCEEREVLGISLGWTASGFPSALFRPTYWQLKKIKLSFVCLFVSPLLWRCLFWDTHFCEKPCLPFGTVQYPPPKPAENTSGFVEPDSDSRRGKFKHR